MTRSPLARLRAYLTDRSEDAPGLEDQAQEARQLLELLERSVLVTFAGEGLADHSIDTAPGVQPAQVYAMAWHVDEWAREVRAYTRAASMQAREAQAQALNDVAQALQVERRRGRPS